MYIHCINLHFISNLAKQFYQSYFIFQMDSSLQTNFTQLYQLPIVKWAQKMVDYGRRNQLINIIQILPTIQHLATFGIDFKDIDETLMQELEKIANKDCIIHEFEVDLNMPLQRYLSKTIQIVQYNRQQYFTKITSIFDHYFKESSTMLTKFLASIHGNQSISMQALRHFMYNQTSVIKNYTLSQFCNWKMEQQSKRHDDMVKIAPQNKNQSLKSKKKKSEEKPNEKIMDKIKRVVNLSNKYACK